MLIIFGCHFNSYSLHVFCVKLQTKVLCSHIYINMEISMVKSGLNVARDV